MTVQSPSPSSDLSSESSTSESSASDASISTFSAPVSPRLAPFSLQSWEWRGYRIPFTVVGPDHGLPLVLIHGFGASIGHWSQNMPVLAAAGYRVFALDLLGFGAAPKPAIAYSLDLWQELLHDFCQELVQQPAVLVGNSIGALLALMMAVNHSDQVRGAVLLNCAGGLNHRPDELNPVLGWVMGTFAKVVNSPTVGPWLFELVRRKSQIKRTLYQVYGNRNAVTDELVDLLYQPSCDPGAQKVFASILTAPAGPSPEELLPQLERPLLVLWGEADPWTPVQGSHIFREYATTKAIEYIGLPKTGHCPHDDRPELVNPAILEWLERYDDNWRKCTSPFHTTEEYPMSTDPATLMKQAVGRAAAQRVQSNTIVGLGTGSTTAYAIQYIGERLQSGDLQNIKGVPTSFQARVLAKQYGIPLTTLDEVDAIAVAIDGADEVDPQKNLIKGGGAAHTQEKIVDALAEQFIVVVDSGKLVEHLGSTFLLPVEVLPMAVTPVMRKLEALGGKPQLRMGVKKAGPVVSDQGNLIVDVKFDSIPNPAELESTINNIPGVLENGLFVGVADVILVGEVKDGQPVVREL